MGHFGLFFFVFVFSFSLKNIYRTCHWIRIPSTSILFFNILLLVVCEVPEDNKGPLLVQYFISN